MAQTVEQILEALTAAIRAQLLPEVRAEVRAEVNAAIDRGGQKNVTTKKAPKSNHDTSELRNYAKNTTLPKVKPGQRRSEADIQQAAHVLTIWLRKNPESRVDQMADALQVPVKDLQRPLAWLIANKKAAKVKGTKLRGTKYVVKP